MKECQALLGCRRLHQVEQLDDLAFVSQFSGHPPPKCSGTLWVHICPQILLALHLSTQCFMRKILGWILLAQQSGSPGCGWAKGGARRPGRNVHCSWPVATERSGRRWLLWQQGHLER